MNDIKSSFYILPSFKMYFIILSFVVAINTEYLLFGFVNGILTIVSQPFKDQPWVVHLLVIIENSSIETNSE